MYNGRVSQHTVFGDMRARALSVYRVKTQASIYLVGFHEARGRRFVIVRGEPGTDREHVVVRDSDPRVGEQSMFEVPPAEWSGKTLEVATMISSTIVSVTLETDEVAIAAVGPDGDTIINPWARPNPNAKAGSAAAVVVTPPGGIPQVPRPPHMPESPRIVPARAKGTHPAQAAVGLPIQAKVAKQVVVGGAAQPAEAEVPYPERHVLYAENIAALLRSIMRRDRLYDDVRPDQRDRLRRSLDDAAGLLEQIRRRDRK
jgi:hypothetical protein